MLSKAWSIVALTVAALGLFTASAQARVRAAGTHHTTSHGGSLQRRPRRLAQGWQLPQHQYQ